MSNNCLRLIENNLIKVLNIACELDDCNPDTIDNIIYTYRKIKLCRLLDSNNFVAIGGTQGAGKTTLLAEMYKSEKYQISDWLEPNTGRGEQLPVFVYEKSNIETPEAVKVIYNKKEQKEAEVTCSNDEFKKIIKDWLYKSNDEERIMYVKLFVPVRFNIKFGWALLPGYEVETRKNKIWLQMMQYVMTHSLGVIIVTNEGRLAQDQSSVVNDLLVTLDVRKPIIVISNADQFECDQQKMNDLKNTASKVFKVNANQITFSGIGFEKWNDGFQKVLSSNLMYDSNVEMHKIESLIKIIEQDISTIINDLNRIYDKQTINRGEKEKLVDEIINVFEKSRKNYFNSLLKNVNSETDILVKNAIEEAKNAYKKEEEGILNNVKILANKLTLKSSEIEERRKERVENEFKGEYIVRCNLNAISKTARDKLNIALDFKPEKNNVLGYKNEKYEESNSSILDDENQHQVINGLNILLRKESLRRIDPNTKIDENCINKALQILPALAMEYSRITQYAFLNHSIINSDSQIIDHSRNKETVQTYVQDFFNDTEFMADNLKIFVGVLGGLVGVDLMDGKLDGKIDKSDSDNNVEGSDSQSLNIDSAAIFATRISGVAMAFVTLAYAGYQTSNTIALSDQNNREFIELYANQIGRKNIEFIASTYNEQMQDLSNFLRQNLEEMYNITSLDKQHHLIYALNDLKKSQGYIKKILYNEQKNMV